MFERILFLELTFSSQNELGPNFRVLPLHGDGQYAFIDQMLALGAIGGSSSGMTVTFSRLLSGGVLIINGK